MNSLYEIIGNWKQISDMLYEEEIDEECLKDTLEAIEGEFEDKADNYAKIIKNLLAAANAKENEIKELQKKKEAEENRAKLLKKMLYEAMKEMNKPKFKTELFSFNIQKNGGKQALTIDGEVPDTYTKVVVENDTDKIRQALENGEKLTFAHLEPRGESLRIK